MHQWNLQILNFFPPLGKENQLLMKLSIKNMLEIYAIMESSDEAYFCIYQLLHRKDDHFRNLYQGKRKKLTSSVDFI